MSLFLWLNVDDACSSPLLRARYDKLKYIVNLSQNFSPSAIKRKRKRKKKRKRARFIKLNKHFCILIILAMALVLIASLYVELKYGTLTCSKALIMEPQCNTSSLVVSKLATCAPITTDKQNKSKRASF